MALGATGRINITSKDKLLANQGHPHTADPDAKRQIQRTNSPTLVRRRLFRQPHPPHRLGSDTYHVELYGDTALITYSQTVTQTGHRDPAMNVLSSSHAFF